MPAKQNETSYFTTALIILAVFFVVFLFIPHNVVEKGIYDEHEQIEAFYGKHTSRDVIGAAAGWYKTAVIDTNLEGKLRSALLIGNTEVGRDPLDELNGKLSFLRDAIHRTIDGIDEYIDSRITVLLDYIFWGMARFSMLIHWLPLWLPIFVVACYNGFCAKKIKSMSYGYVNPSLVRLWGKVIGLAAFVSFVAFITPWSIPPILIPVLFAFFVCGVGFMISNLQWRI